MNPAFLWLIIFLAVLAWLEWGIAIPMRWLEGWMIPHSKPKAHCFVKCGTCTKGIR